VTRAPTWPVGPEVSACAAAFEAELDYVYRTLRRLGVAEGEAEDLVQDVFVVVARRWGDYRPERPLRPWLAGIARYIALDHARRHSRREVATESIECRDEGPGPDDQLAAARRRALALRALASLPDSHRAVLVKYELDGESIRDIAAQWRMPFFTVAARLRRARLRFAAAVEQLQAGATGTAALLQAEEILAAERALPKVTPPVRARLRAKLALVPLVATPATPGPRVRARSWLVPAAMGVGATLLVAVAFTARSNRARQSAFIVEAARAPRRALGVPRLLTSALPTPPPGAEPPAALDTTADSGAAHATGDGLARGLVAQWHFEDGPASPVAHDSSGHGRDCTLHGLPGDRARVAGAVGTALDLSHGGWLDCPLPEARADFPLTLSAALWIKRGVPKLRRESALLSRQLANADHRQLFWFGVREDSLAVSSQAWTGWTGGPRQAWLEGWTHVAFVHDGSQTRLYINGTLVRHTYGQVARGQGVVNSALIIGGRRFARDPLRVRHHFEGQIDEAMIYDRPLTDAEVAALARRR
jgi:RNA polymerase sigma factor (sigma-70 family)